MHAALGHAPRRGGTNVKSYTVRKRQELSPLLDDPKFAAAETIQLVEIIMEMHDAPRAQYAALYLAEGGAAAASPIVLCWFETNLGNHHRRAVGTAAQIGFGNSECCGTPSIWNG